MKRIVYRGHERGLYISNNLRSFMDNLEKSECIIDGSSKKPFVHENLVYFLHPLSVCAESKKIEIAHPSHRGLEIMEPAYVSLTLYGGKDNTGKLARIIEKENDRIIGERRAAIEKIKELKVQTRTVKK